MLKRFCAIVTIVAAISVALPQAASARPAALSIADCKLRGTTGWTDEGHNTDRTQFMAATGTVRAMMLFVDFPDAVAPSADTTEYSNHLAGARDFFAAASYGRVNLVMTPVPQWFRMPQDSGTYGFDRGITWEQHELYVRQAVAAADPYVNFSGYNLVYIVPPKNAARITFSPAYLFDPNTSGVVADGSRLKWGVTFGQDMWHWGSKVANHETGHLMGLPDLYAFTDPNGTGDWHRFVGGWDLMGHIAGHAPQYFAWEAWKLGWLDDAAVKCAPAHRRVTYSLTPVEQSGGTKMVVIRTGTTTAYVAESRRATGLDAAACSQGVLVYKVDTSTWTGEGPVRVIDSRPGVTPPAGCKPLDDAAYGTGGLFTDSATGVRIKVLSSAGQLDWIEVTRP